MLLLCIKGAKSNKKTLHLFVILLFVYFTCSDFSFGFHTLTPTYPPIPDTTAITANVKRYENTILKNSIKFAINTTSHSAGNNLQKSFQQFIKINFFAIHIIPLGLLHRQAELLLFLFKLITVVTVHTDLAFTVLSCPFISCRFVQSDNSFRQFPTTYFMLGVRPIKVNIQNALCEQAPNSILYIHFCMAELLLKLRPIKLIIKSFLIHQLLVCSLFYNFTMIHYQDHIRILNC